MYKRNFRKPAASTSKMPLPVVLSQRTSQAVEKEREEDEVVPNSQDQNNEILVIPSSQNENEPQNMLSQSRFISQRSQISRLTQDAQLRGKNYFEIALLACKIKVTEFGELMNFITMRKSP